MLRTKLRNIPNDRSEENKQNYKKQRNASVKLARRSNRNYYSSLNEKKALPNKATIANEKIRLIKGDEIKRG